MKSHARNAASPKSRKRRTVNCCWSSSAWTLRLTQKKRSIKNSCTSTHRQLGWQIPLLLTLRMHIKLQSSPLRETQVQQMQSSRRCCGRPQWVPNGSMSERWGRRSRLHLSISTRFPTWRIRYRKYRMFLKSIIKHSKWTRKCLNRRKTDRPLSDLQRRRLVWRRRTTSMPRRNIRSVRAFAECSTMTHLGWMEQCEVSYQTEYAVNRQKLIQNRCY